MSESGGERPACPLCGAPVEVTAMTYGFPKLKFFGGAVGEREGLDRCDRIMNNGMGEPTECGRTLPCEYHGDSELDEAIGLLHRLVDYEDSPCRLDHHGNCQEHHLENPCTIREAREFLARLSVNEGGPGVGEREEPFDRLALREELAALEHEQWEAWSRDVARLGLTTARRQRWARCWVPYADLDETAKDADREWADKVLAILARLSVNEGGVARTEPLEAAIRRICNVLDNDEGGAELYEAALELYRARTEAEPHE